MLFWPKLLSIAHAIASSVRPFLPLYLSHFLGFTCSEIGALLAVPLALRAVSLGFWTVLIVDQRPQLQGFFMALLTAIGTVGLVLLFWIPPHSPFAWSAALVCMLLDGIFYQPLGVLIDSAIIKILGNYKILFYDAQRQWGYLASAIMAVIIGWSLDEDHDFDTLMGMVLTGSILLSLLSLSTTVSPADPALLGVQHLVVDDDQLLAPAGEHSPLLKSTQDLSTTTTVISYSERPPLSNRFYRPYCLFNEQLSHISEEEDSSQLQRVASDASARQYANSTIEEEESATATAAAAVAEIPDIESVCSSGQYWAANTTASTTANNIHDDELFNFVPSLPLVLFPSPTPESPMIALAATVLAFPDDEPDTGPMFVICLLSTMALLGIASAAVNALMYIYLHDNLGLPMHLVGLVGMLDIAAHVAARHLVRWLVHRCRHLVTIVHLLLFACLLGYSCLRPGHVVVHAAAVALQIMQIFGFQAIWLVAVRQMDNMFMAMGQRRRMDLRAKMSALYSSLGPALGALLAGYIADRGGNNHDFTLLFRVAAMLVAVDSPVSWYWSTFTIE